MRAAAAAFAVALVACTGPPDIPLSPGPQSPSATTPGSHGRPSPSATAAFAVWPEDSPAEADQAAEGLASGRDPWRADGVETALEFARQVLGWTSPVAGSPTSMESTTLFVRLERGSAEGYATMQVARLVGNEWWSVVAIQGPVPPSPPPVRIRDGLAGVGVSLGELASAEVTLGYGNRDVTETTRESGEVTLEVPDHSAPGHLLILFKDQSGAIVSAFGTALPAGDFAAG